MTKADTLFDIKARMGARLDPGLTFLTLRDKIAAEKVIRKARYAAFGELLSLAHETGKAAADEYPDKQPVPVGGVGFAWVTVYPGNKSFAIWSIKEAGWSKHYRGGVRASVPGYDQNEGRKMAYATAFAAVLREAGLNAYPGSRLD